MSRDVPHKFSQEISSHGGGTDYHPWCEFCGKKAGHPIHQRKYRGKPLTYQLAKENGFKP